MHCRIVYVLEKCIYCLQPLLILAMYFFNRRIQTFDTDVRLFLRPIAGNKRTDCDERGESAFDHAEDFAADKLQAGRYSVEYLHSVQDRHDCRHRHLP